MIHFSFRCHCFNEEKHLDHLFKRFAIYLSAVSLPHDLVVVCFSMLLCPFPFAPRARELKMNDTV